MCNIRKLLIATVLAFMLCSGCSNAAKDTLLEPADPITLQFIPVEDVQEIHEVRQIAEEEIVREQVVSEGTIILYTKQGDSDYLYGAYKTKDAIFELGVVSGWFDNVDEFLSIDELNLFDTRLVRIKGIFGANAPVQNYYSIEHGKINTFLCIDTGHALEVDLDGNGTVEIISSHGAAIQTYIYRWENDQFTIADVNEALGATSVYLNPDEQLEAFYHSTQTSQRFSYDAGVLRSIN
jgi:hypothetical protein